eukprot:535766_1
MPEEHEHKAKSEELSDEELQMDQDFQDFLRMFLNPEVEGCLRGITAIWNRMGIIGTVAQRNALFRLLLSGLTPETSGCLESITGRGFVLNYLPQGADQIQEHELTEMPPARVYRAFPLWFVRSAFVVLGNMPYLVRCLKEITGEDGQLDFSLRSTLETIPLVLPEEDTLKIINKYPVEIVVKVTEVTAANSRKRPAGGNSP